MPKETTQKQNHKSVEITSIFKEDGKTLQELMEELLKTIIIKK